MKSKLKNSINIKGFNLNLNFDEQISPNGSKIRLSGIGKNLQVPEKWIDKTYKSHWFYTFRYVGTDKFITFEFDYYDKFLRIIK